MSPIFFIFAVFGSCLGSFAGCLIYRLHHNQKGILAGRSKDITTGENLKWWELVPIFSWLFLRGKSSRSGKKIPFFYFLIEIVFAVIFGIFADKFWELESLEFFIFLSLIFLVLTLFFYDLYYFEVDRRISIPTIFLSLIFIFFQTENWLEIREFLLGGLLGFLFYFFQYFYSKGKWVGGGDQDLGLIMGILLGWKLFLLSLFLSYIFGSLVAIFIMIFKKNFSRKSHLPMGAFLMPSLLLFLIFGQEIFTWFIQNILY